MFRRVVRRSRKAGLALVLTACTGGDRSGDDSARAAAQEPLPTPAPASAGGGAAALDSAARRIVGFLQGRVSFDSLSVADTVTLYVAPEGGGGRALLSREQLRDRTGWVVRSGRPTFHFAPGAGMTELTTAVGRHFNCMEYALESRLPELAPLAGRPHVGTKLAPPGAGSCLQTWNATFIFDTTGGRRRLTAAVYDQWEW